MSAKQMITASASRNDEHSNDANCITQMKFEKKVLAQFPESLVT